MDNYKEIRKQLLADLKKRGIQAPAKAFPVISFFTHPAHFEYYQQEQIDQMREALVKIDVNKERDSRQ